MAQITTMTGIAVVVMALARFLASRYPGLPVCLRENLAGAEAAGIASDDLEFLRTVVKALEQKHG